MKTPMLAAIVLAASASFTSPASAAAPSDTDLLCGMVNMINPDPDAPDGQAAAFVFGGPIAQNGTITCTIQAGANDLHAEDDSSLPVWATGTRGVTMLAPQGVSYLGLEPLENVYLCDQFTDSGGTVYQFDDVDGAWEVANGTQTCRLAISASTEDPLITGIEEAIDGVICPVLAIVGGTGLVDVPGVVAIRSDGDIELAGSDLWICPPYESRAASAGADVTVHVVLPYVWRL